MNSSNIHNTTTLNAVDAPFTHLTQTQTWMGAFWKILSCAAFAGINSVVHYLSSDSQVSHSTPLPSNVIMFFQNVFGALFLLPLILKTTVQLGVRSLGTRHPLLHFIRVGTAVLGVALWYYALKFLPIAEGVALQFTGPIITVLAAWILLGEHISLLRGIAITISIVGAFIITRPDIPLLGGEHPLGFAVIFPLLSAVTLSFNKIITRKLATLGEPAERMAIYLLVFMAPISFVPAYVQWQTPELSHLPWLLLLGLLATTAHLAFAKAYQLSEVTFLTPFGFFKFLFSALLGYLIFTEVPSSKVWFGSVIIFVSIVLLSNQHSLNRIVAFVRRFKLQRLFSS